MECGDCKSELHFCKIHQKRDEARYELAEYHRCDTRNISEKEIDLFLKIQCFDTLRDEKIFDISQRIIELTDKLDWDRERDEGDDDEIMYALFQNNNNMQYQTSNNIDTVFEMNDRELLEILRLAKAERDNEIGA